MKKLPKVHSSDVLGAMYVSRDTGGNGVRVWPAIQGIKKYYGCVAYGLGTSNITQASKCKCYNSMNLNKSECIEWYYDYPGGSQAWLVIPNGKDWLWTRVDYLIGFS